MLLLSGLAWLCSAYRCCAVTERLEKENFTLFKAFPFILWRLRKRHSLWSLIQTLHSSSVHLDLKSSFCAVLDVVLWAAALSAGWTQSIQISFLTGHPAGREQPDSCSRTLQQDEKQDAWLLGRCNLLTNGGKKKQAQRSNTFMFHTDPDNSQ